MLWYSPSCRSLGNKLIDLKHHETHEDPPTQHLITKIHWKFLAFAFPSMRISPSTNKFLILAPKAVPLQPDYPTFLLFSSLLNFQLKLPFFRLRCFSLPLSLHFYSSLFSFCCLFLISARAANILPSNLSFCNSNSLSSFFLDLYQLLQSTQTPSFLSQTVKMLPKFFSGIFQKLI